MQSGLPHWEGVWIGQGRFIPDPMEDTFCALKDYRKIVLGHGVEPAQTLVTATEAARIATNAKDFFREVEAALGFRIHIVTAEGEAYYTFRGVVCDGDDNTSVIMDIGGASTELIKVSGGVLERTTSLPVGSVRATGLESGEGF